MKKRIVAILMVVGFFAVAASVSNAQIVKQIKTKVPFAFTVSGTELPAGDYVILYGGFSANSVIVRSTDGSNAAVLLVRSELIEGLDSTNGVDFSKIDGKYYLDGITIYALRLDASTGRKADERLRIAAK